MEEETAVGVPPIDPVVVLKERPAGSVGVMDHEETAPPLAVGVTVVIETPLAKVSELGL